MDNKSDLFLLKLVTKQNMQEKKMVYTYKYIFKVYNNYLKTFLAFLIFKR